MTVELTNIYMTIFKKKDLQVLPFSPDSNLPIRIKVVCSNKMFIKSFPILTSFILKEKKNCDHIQCVSP